MTARVLRVFSIITLSGLFLSGCVTTQTIQPVTKDSRIVIVSAVGDNATYKLVATTVLQNAETQYKLNNFNVDQSIASAAKEQLQSLGYRNVTIIHLPKDNVLTQDFPFEAGWSTVGLKADAAQYLREIIAGQHADYVLYFKRGAACSPMGCGVNTVYGYGITKRSVLGIHTSNAYAVLSLNVFDAKTLARIEDNDESEFDSSHRDQLSDDASFYNNDINYLKNWLVTSYRKETVKAVSNNKMLTQNAPYRKINF